MNIRVFSSQEEMDDDFEEMMEKEQEKAYLEERINQQRYEIESCQEALIQAKEEMDALEKQLEELRDN